MMKVVIIGGGAAGMYCAAHIKNHKVTIVEKNEKLGKKLYITGKGRCNITNNCDVENIIENTMSNPYFMYSALYTCTPQDTISFFQQEIKTKVERGNRVFPLSDKSSDIIKALEKTLRKNNVKIMLNSEVVKIDSNKVILKNKTINADIIIIATGGLSYKTTGSTGDGYKFAKDFGHNITKLYPALVPLTTAEKDIYDLQGLSLRNIELSVLVNNKIAFKEFGEIIFTHYGISGPLTLKASRTLVDKYNSEIYLSIDLKPALDINKLDARILRDFDENKNKAFKNSLNKLLPQKIIPLVIKRSNIEENKLVNEITKVERKKLVNIIKIFKITINGNTGYKDAVITCGGIDVKDIDPSTMESKLVKNLYFIGEVLDVDCYTGGYNLQTAFSMAFLAAQNISLLP
ncbi:MAG: NAD(P)/FAD-dependent oxidoreductase [Lachnospirales bacterium]